MFAEPDVYDAIAAQPLIHATGNGFYFRQLGHLFIVGERGILRRVLASGLRLALIFRHFPLIFFASTHLQAAPFLEIDEAQAQPNQKHTNRCVLNQVELAVFFLGLVDHDAVNLARNHAILSFDRPSRHHVEIVCGEHGRTDQPCKSG